MSIWLIYREEIEGLVRIVEVCLIFNGFSDHGCSLPMSVGSQVRWKLNGQVTTGTVLACICVLGTIRGVCYTPWTLHSLSGWWLVCLKCTLSGVNWGYGKAESLSSTIPLSKYKFGIPQLGALALPWTMTTVMKDTAALVIHPQVIWCSQVHTDHCAVQKSEVSKGPKYLADKWLTITWKQGRAHSPVSMNW